MSDPTDTPPGKGFRQTPGGLPSKAFRRSQRDCCVKNTQKGSSICVHVYGSIREFAGFGNADEDGSGIKPQRSEQPMSFIHGQP